MSRNSIGIILAACIVLAPDHPMNARTLNASPRGPTVPSSTAALSFSSFAGLATAYTSAVAWGDYDNDGNMDILQAGTVTTSPFGPSLYHNNGDGTFSNLDIGLPAAHSPAVAWGDYDNDGWMDFILTGYNSPAGGGITHLYRNNGNSTFTYVPTTLPGVYVGSVAWADFDNDGRSDVLLAGYADVVASGLCRIYHNNGDGTFSDMSAGFPGVYDAAVAAADFDNDGRMDVLITGNMGTPATPVSISRVYHNNGDGSFTDVGAGLVGVRESAVAVADLSGHGSSDIILCGDSGTGGVQVRTTRVYRNNGDGTFVEMGPGLVGVNGGSVSIADCEGDGTPDVLLTGYSGTVGVTNVYINDGAYGFTSVTSTPPKVWYSSVAWADIFGSGHMQFLLTGTTTGDPSGAYAAAWNVGGTSVLTNAPPNPPTGLTSHYADGQIVMSWNTASDDRTPAAGLTYNIRVGTTPGGSEICSALARNSDGRRKLPAFGNAQHRTTWALTVAPTGAYYWSVQAIDASYLASPFAGEGTVGVEAAGAAASEPVLRLQGAQPVHGDLKVSFTLPAERGLTLAVYDVTGRRVAVLLEGRFPAGVHEAVWRASERRKLTSSGVYFVCLATSAGWDVRRVVALQ